MPSAPATPVEPPATEAASGGIQSCAAIGRASRRKSGEYFMASYLERARSECKKLLILSSGDGIIRTVMRMAVLFLLVLAVGCTVRRPRQGPQRYGTCWGTGADPCSATCYCRAGEPEACACADDCPCNKKH